MGIIFNPTNIYKTDVIMWFTEFIFKGYDMKRIIVFLLSLACLIGCSGKTSNTSEQFIGKWQNEGISGLTMIITKVDDNNFNVNITDPTAMRMGSGMQMVRSTKVSDHKVVLNPDGDLKGTTIGFSAKISVKDDGVLQVTGDGRNCTNCNLYKKVN